MPTFREDIRLGTKVPQMKTEDYEDGSVTTEKLADEAVTSSILGNGAVENSNIKDGSISSEKLEDGSVTNEKLAVNSITKDKLKDRTIGVEKLDNELRQTIAAATGLPEELVESIQNMDETVSEHTKQIESNQSQITANKSAQDEKNISLEENMKKLNVRDDQITESLKSIAVSGGASIATAVTYDNTSSQLVSATVQGAVDELQGSKIDKTSILQGTGKSEDKVMSQKAVSDRQKAIRDSLYTEKETKVVTTAGLQGLTSNTGTFYVIETPIHVIYKSKSYPHGSVDVCIGFLNKNKEVVKSWSKKDATKDDQGNWCFDVYSDDWEGACYLRVDNAIVSLEIYKKPERNTIVDYISKVNFESYINQRFNEVIKGYRVSGNHQVDNDGNKRSLYNIQNNAKLTFKLSASEIKEINSDVLYFYICNEEFAGGQFGHGLTVSDGTNTINVPYTFKYNDRFRTFSIDFDYYKIDVSTLDKNKPWSFIVGFGNTISAFHKYRKFIRLSNKLWNGRDLWVESNVRGLINVFDNWTWHKSDDIPTLNDAIIATKEGGTLIIPKGDYNVSDNCTANLTGNGVDDTVTIYKPITIIGDSKTRFVGGKAITSADLYDEENKIYVHDINDAENGYIYTTSIWICQDGTSDEDTAVVPSEMNALYHKRTHRMNMCSRIYRVTSIDAIKSASKPSFYIDTAANKMYFTIKDGTTLENCPVYIGRNPKDDYRHNNDVNLLIGPTHDVTIRNIDFAYGRIQVEGVENCTIENCITYGMPGNYSTGFGISPSSKYVKIVNCEICGNSSDGLNCSTKHGPISGSFIDTDYNGTGMSRTGIFVYMKDCWVHDNSDDGISEHGAGCFIIEDSLLEYNGVSGCTVAGSDSNYIGCIFRKNAWRSIERAGFENLSNDSVGHCLVKDCVAIDNYGQADYSLRSMGLNSYTTFQNCKSIRTETEIPSWVSGYSTLNPVGFEVENKSVNHAVLMDCTSNRAIKTRFGSSADVKVFSGENISIQQ